MTYDELINWLVSLLDPEDETTFRLALGVLRGAWVRGGK